MVPPASHEISRASWYSGYSPLFLLFVYRILTFCDWPSHAIRLSIHQFWESYNPKSEDLVWALPSSLAATGGIEFSFSSFGYLDVSVPRVALPYLCIQYGMNEYYSIRVFPFGYPRVFACLQLVVAFRSLPRPSSALSAKASTVCPYSLDLCFLRTIYYRCSLLSYILPCEWDDVRVFLFFLPWFLRSLVVRTVQSIFSVGNCFTCCFR